MQRRQLHDITAAVLFALATAGLVTAEGNEARAAALVARFRQALGGEARLSAVKSLTFEADMRRVLPGDGSRPGPEMAGDIKLDIGGPTQYLFIDSFAPLPGMPPVSIGSALDGDTEWSAALSAPSGPVMIRAGGGDPAQLRARLERDLTRLSVALLAGSSIPGVAFTYAGLAESPEGKAEVLEVKGPGDFTGKLFLDEKTARPLMLTYQERERRMAIRRERPGTGAPPAGHGDPAAGGSGGEEAPPAMKEARMFLSDYKTEDGISWPHSITITIQDGQTEEWTVQRVKVNPTFAADHFKKR